MAIDKQTQQDIINYLVSQGYTDEMIKEVIASYDDTPPQAPPVNSTQLDRVVAVVDKVNTKVDGKASAGLKASDGNGNVDISTMDGSTHAKTLSSVQLVSDFLVPYKSWNDTVTVLAACKFRRADGSVIGFTGINASGNPAATGATQDYVDAKAPNKQLVVVFNDGSSKSFKVG